MKRKISVPRQIMQPLSTETNINVTLSAKRRVPGVMDFWMLIAAEVTLFSLFFITYMISRNQSLELFVTSQQMLNRHLGAFNTVVLISGSWLVTQAVLMLRQGHVDEARRYLTYAASSGIVFLGVKLFEYGEKISQGISPISNDFFTFYFILF